MSKFAMKPPKVELVKGYHIPFGKYQYGVNAVNEVAQGPVAWQEDSVAITKIHGGVSVSFRHIEGMERYWIYRRNMLTGTEALVGEVKVDTLPIHPAPGGLLTFMDMGIPRPRRVCFE